MNALSKGHRRGIARVLALAACLCAMLAAGMLAGCSSPAQGELEGQPEPAAEKALEGKTLDIYCGAGMTDPFQEIADAFQAQTQITTTEQGDFFIAGSADELKPVEAFVETSTDLVKHIPVLAVPAGNPQNVAGLADLSGASRVLVGDPESTPIGKIAKNALTKAGLWDSLMAANVLTTTTTAPQIATALANGEGDAGIVWKENVKGDGVKIVDTPDLDAFVKTVPSAQLTCAKDAEATKAFSEFLQTDAAWDIWAAYGYERV